MLFKTLALSCTCHTSQFPPDRLVLSIMTVVVQQLKRVHSVHSRNGKQVVAAVGNMSDSLINEYAASRMYVTSMQQVLLMTCRQH